VVVGGVVYPENHIVIDVGRTIAGKQQRNAANYEQALTNIRRLSEHDPDNTLWLRDMTVMLKQLGDAKLQTGDAGAAAASYDEALAIRTPTGSARSGQCAVAIRPLDRVLQAGRGQAQPGRHCRRSRFLRGWAADHPPSRLRRSRQSATTNQPCFQPLPAGERTGWVRTQARAERSPGDRRTTARAKQLTPEKIGWPGLIWQMLASGP
jgi:hypothetical protein